MGWFSIKHLHMYISGSSVPPAKGYSLYGTYVFSTKKKEGFRGKQRLCGNHHSRHSCPGPVSILSLCQFSSASGGKLACLIGETYSLQTRPLNHIPSSIPWALQRLVLDIMVFASWDKQKTDQDSRRDAESKRDVRALWLNWWLTLSPPSKTGMHPERINGSELYRGWNQQNNNQK